MGVARIGYIRRMTGDEIVRERDFYRRLLDLGGAAEVEPLLEQALALVVEVTRAEVAYLELHDDDPDDAAPPRYWRGHHVTCAEAATIRESISRGIIARTLADGRTVETPSALDDTRFEDLGSVRRHEIQAVLCAPIGTAPPIGVIYLQGTVRPGGFDATDRQRLELFARQLAPIADRLLAPRARAAVTDHTQEVRQRFRCPNLIGRSRALAHVLQEASLVAPLDIDVLITGPAGTGKTALARALAENSRRAGGPFVAINCAAIPETLIESELFGAERGAHSQANRRLPGKVAAAEGGTLLLDEIGDLPASGQAKLLHLLQAREYHPLGATSTIRADVRIISATNVDLRQKVAAREFREDLFYRLHVVPLAMPGLHERKDDIPELVEHVCAEACRRHDLPAMTVSRRAQLACRDASWPGHVRELAHAIEAAVIRAHGERSTVVLEHHVFPAADRAADDGRRATFHEATRDFQRRYLLELLEANDWNVARTARELELARAHVYNLIHALGLRR